MPMMSKHYFFPFSSQTIQRRQSSEAHQQQQQANTRIYTNTMTEFLQNHEKDGKEKEEEEEMVLLNATATADAISFEAAATQLVTEKEAAQRYFNAVYRHHPLYHVVVMLSCVVAYTAWMKTNEKSTYILLPLPPPSMNEQLQDLLPTILSYVDATTLSTCAQVCRQWRAIEHTNQDYYWERLCRTTFSVSSYALQHPQPRPKALYSVIATQRRRLLYHHDHVDTPAFTTTALPTIAVRTSSSSR